MRRPLSAVSSAAGPPGPADLTAAAVPLRPGAPAAIITRGGRAAQATGTTPGAAAPSGGASGTSGGASGTSGDGTVFRGGLATALTAPGISATVALAPLTTGGTAGSATFSQGILTAYVPPT